MSWSIPIALGDQGIIRPGGWRAARSLAWMVAMVFAIMLAFGPAVEALSHSMPAQPAFRFLAKAVGALIVLGTYAVLVRLGEKRWPQEIAPAAAPFGIIAGLAIGLIMFSTVMTILIGTGLYDFTYRGPASVWRGASLALESGVLEEVLVRGLVLRLVWRAFGPAIAFAVSGLLFCFGHIGNPGATWFTTACVAIEAGIMLGAFYALTGRLWMSIGVHAGWNFTQGYVFGAHVSGGDFGASIATSAAQANLPDWLTGGAFGPEASVPALVVCSVVGAGVLWLACRFDQFSEITFGSRWVAPTGANAS